MDNQSTVVKAPEVVLSSLHQLAGQASTDQAVAWLAASEHHPLVHVASYIRTAKPISVSAQGPLTADLGKSAAVLHFSTIDFWC